MTIKLRFQAMMTWIKKILSGWYFHITLFLLTLMLITLAIASPHIGNWINRPISVVKVAGKFHHLSRKGIEKQLSSIVSTRFFSLESKQVKTVLMSIPWVGHAGIRKQWPDTLWVELRERIPAARWNDKALVDTHGNIFMPESIGNTADHLPLLKGEKGDEKTTWNNFLLFKKLLSVKNIQEKISTFAMTETGDWLFDLGGVSIRISQKHHVKSIKMLHDLYFTRLQNAWSDITSMDFRYTNGAAVKWKAGKKPETGKSPSRQ